MVGKVYIASPYWDDDHFVRYENVKRQMHIADKLLAEGFLPFWPLHYFFIEQHHHREEVEWLAISLQWMRSMDALVRLDGDSKGADREVAFAQDINIPVFFGVDDLLKNRKEVRQNARSRAHT